MLCRYPARAGTNALISGSAACAQSLTRAAPTRLVAAAAAALHTATPTTTTHRGHALAGFRRNVIYALPTKRYFTLFGGASDKTSNEAASNAPASGEDLPTERAANDHRPPFTDILAKQITLWAPWTIERLHPVEQEAYRTHGADYMQHLDERAAKAAIRHARGRWVREKYMRKRHGDELWYQVEEEVSEQWPAKEFEMLRPLRQRRKELDLDEAEGRVEKSVAEGKRRQLRKDYRETGTRLDKRLKFEAEIRAALEQKRLS